MTIDAVSVLLSRYEKLPARASAAASVLSLVDDPNTSAQSLAKAIASDAMFAARVLRVANSPYYGLSGRVGTLPFAISVIGFQTVRSLAVAAAAGLDNSEAAPPEFWRAAATTAIVAELVAPRLGAHTGDAFTLGLLHLIGSALLHQHQPLAALCLPEPPDAAALLRDEEEAYGITHDAAGARVLTAWRFPARLCTLIARHHEHPLPDAPALERTLLVARVLASEMLGQTAELTVTQVSWISQGQVTGSDMSELFDRAADKTEGLLQGLQPRH